MNQSKKSFFSVTSAMSARNFMNFLDNELKFAALAGKNKAATSENEEEKQ